MALPGSDVSRALVSTVLLLAASACAAKTSVLSVPHSILDARALMEEGCYVCLLDAQHALVESAARNDVARHLEAEVTVLIALRERELGLPDSKQLERLSARLGSAAAEMRLLIDVAEAMPWNRRFAVTEDIALRRKVMASRDKWYPALERLSGASLAARYLLLTMNCNYPLTDSSPPQGHEGDPPLLRFRLAICQGRDIGVLSRLVDTVPRFGEARYLLGLAFLLQGRIDDARAAVEGAMEVIPNWPAAANTLGNVAFSQEEFAHAQSMFDGTLAVDPLDRDALLGRIKALSYQSRYAEALASADRMLALGEYYVGDGHYWRAWNLYRLGQFEDAARAITAAKEYMRGPDASALAGYIAVGRVQLEEARREFSEALDGAPSDCDVRYARAAVDLQLGAWGASAADFERALSCYEQRERELAEAARRLTPDNRRGRAARARDMGEARMQQARAALQAALAWTSAGEYERARRQALRAKTVPELSAAADDVLKRLPDR